jgi:hypothetical protein
VLRRLRLRLSSLERRASGKRRSHSRRRSPCRTCADGRSTPTKIAWAPRFRLFQPSDESGFSHEAAPSCTSAASAAASACRAALGKGLRKPHWSRRRS